MNSPGRKTLWFGTGDFALTDADTYVGEWTTPEMLGLISATVQLDFAWGSGGTNAKVYIQTTIDGTNAVDMACVVFGVASERVIQNFDASTNLAQRAVTDGTMADDTQISGAVGTQFRLKVVTTGTYVGTTLAGRMTVR